MDDRISFDLFIDDLDAEFLVKLIKVLEPENDQSIELIRNEKNKLLIRCRETKLTSLYSLVDEFLKAHDLVKEL